MTPFINTEVDFRLFDDQGLSLYILVSVVDSDMIFNVRKTVSVCKKLPDEQQRKGDCNVWQTHIFGAKHYQTLIQINIAQNLWMKLLSPFRNGILGN